MIGVGLIIKVDGNFFIGKREKKKFFNEWFIEFVEFKVAMKSLIGFIGLISFIGLSK